MNILPLKPPEMLRIPKEEFWRQGETRYRVHGVK
jgi:hypothetical protein